MQAQLKLRELLEDTPSMVAFSTARSALQKQGLLFLVEVPACVNVMDILTYTYRCRV